MSITRWLYEHSPVWWQNVMCTVAGWQKLRQRYDRRFDERCAFFRQAGRWSPAEVAAYHQEQLRALAAHACQRVPYYRRAFAEHGLRPEGLRTSADWSRLPLLSKDDVRRAGTTLIAEPWTARQLVTSHSGGSTGMPLTCYHDREALADVYASFWVYHRPSVRRGDRYATFQGMPLIPPGQRGGPYWRMNRANGQRLYSIFHLSEATIELYLADLDAFAPVYMQGYANALYLVAQLARETGFSPRHAPAAVFSTSEQLQPHQRQTISEIFRTRVWDAYSQDETCASISEYECGYYHCDHAYGYVEFLDVETQGSRRLAEIVCTGFLNRTWPLLRYRVGDLVEYEPADVCPRCGRAGPIIHAIRGRTGDVLLTPSGRHFPHISLIVKNLRGVRELQLVQRARDRVVIRYVPSEDHDRSRDEEAMVAAFAQAVGEPIHWSIERANEIPRTRAGKFLSIVNEMKAEAASAG
jgi:phenylacetate-CoA ligase